MKPTDSTENKKIYINQVNRIKDLIKSATSINDLLECSSKLDKIAITFTQYADKTRTEQEQTKIKKLQDAKAETTAKIPTIEDSIGKTKDFIGNLPDSDDKSRLNERLKELAKSLEEQQHNLATCENMKKLVEVNQSIESIGLDVKTLTDEVLELSSQAVFEKFKENEAKAEQEKYAEPLKPKQIEELAQKGGDILSKSNEMLKIPVAIVNFTGDTSSPYGIKLSFYKSLIYFSEKDFFDPLTLPPAIATIDESNTNSLFKPAKQIRVDINKRVKQIGLKKLLLLFVNTQSILQKFSENKKSNIFLNEHFLDLFKTTPDNDKKTQTIGNIESIIHKITDNLDEITRNLNTEELEEVISFIGVKIDELAVLISKSQTRQKDSSVFTNSKERHTAIILQITKFKAGCQILKSRLENVKEMLDQLRKKYFENNAVVKNYLKPAPTPTPETASKGPSNSSLSLETSLYTFKTLCEPFEKIVHAFHQLYTTNNPTGVFYAISKLVIYLNDQTTKKIFEEAKTEEEAKTKISHAFVVLFESRQSAYNLKKNELLELTESIKSDNKTQGELESRMRESEIKIENIKKRISEAKILPNATELIAAAEEELTAEQTIHSELLRKQQEIIKLGIEKTRVKPEKDAKIKKVYDTNLQEYLNAAKAAMSSEKNIIDTIYTQTRDIAHKFEQMGITRVSDNQVIFGRTDVAFISNYEPLIKSYSGFDKLLKQIVETIYVIRNTANTAKISIDNLVDHNADLINKNAVERISVLIKQLPPLIQTLSELIQKFNGVLFKYKNAFVTLSFQIATTLFGYGISILQIFMQNFPEQLSFFTEKKFSSQITPPEPPTEDYGLNQLNALKKPVEPFVTAKDIENQSITLDQYTYEPKPTEFSLLTQTLDLTKVPLFREGYVAEMLNISIPAILVGQPMPLGGGKKQRRLLLPPPSHPLQSNKRPKKRKTIKNRSSATNPTHKTTKKNKHYTNKNNNNKTKKNKLLKPILTKANQKRNKKHKRSIRKV